MIYSSDLLATFNQTSPPQPSMKNFFVQYVDLLQCCISVSELMYSIRQSSVRLRCWLCLLGFNACNIVSRRIFIKLQKYVYLFCFTAVLLAVCVTADLNDVFWSLLLN